MQKKVIVPIGVVMLPVIAASVWSWSASAQSAQNQSGQSGASAQQNSKAERDRQSDSDRDRAGRAGQPGQPGQSGQHGQSGAGLSGLGESGSREGREVTLSGRIMDIHSFFTMPDTSRQLQGAPISPGSSGQPGLDNRSPSGSGAGAAAGSSAGAAADAARSSGASAIETGGAMRGAGQSQVMILQTASGPVLISSERKPGAAAQKQLQPGSEEVQVRGRMYERSGLKFVLVTDHRPGGAGQSGTENRSEGGTTGGSGTGAGSTGGSGTGSGQQNR